MQIVGYILIALGAIDFLIGNFGDINLTGFLGPVSSFSPIILIAIVPNTKGYMGALMLNKNDLTFGGAKIFYPFDNYETSDFTSGKCETIN